MNSTRPIIRIFKENGWKCRKSNGSQHNYRTKPGTEAGKKERNERRTKRIKDLREELFGTECRICGVNRDYKILAIHRKDGIEHPKNQLRSIKFLESLNPDAWVPLCVSCHRGIHWLCENKGTTWDDIESYLKQGDNSKAVSDSQGFSAKERQPKEEGKNNQQLEGKVDDLRKSIFGDECYFCGDDYGNRRLTIHRKDGEPHQSSLLWSESRLKSLDPDDWVALCQKCHRYVHWAMDNLQMKWEDFEHIQSTKFTHFAK